MGRISDAYFRPKAFELDGRLYEWLGVLSFKRFLLGLTARSGPGEPPGPYFLRTRDLPGVLAFEKRTRRNELVHLAAMLPSILGLALGGLGARWLVALLVLVLAANFHPFVLQRYNRIRIQRLLARRSAVA